MIETHPFRPFVPKNSRYLILGSFTGKFSSDNNYDWFYGTKRNQFWKILKGVYNLELVTKKDKQALFRKLGIAITDLIYKCERKKNSNLDNNLTNIVYRVATIERIFEKQKIEKVFFSSKFVEKNFKKLFKNIVESYPMIELITLPSPSPRYAKLSLDKKIVEYRKILPIKNKN